MERVVKPFESAADRTQDWPRRTEPAGGGDHAPAVAATRPIAGSLFEHSAAGAAPARVDPGAVAREVELDPSCIDPHLVAFTREDFVGAAEYDRLAVTLLLGAAERGVKRVLVGSARHGDGRTTVTLNLACALAAARRRVLVVDVDMQRPSAARMLGLEASVGLTEAIDRGLGLSDAAVRVSPYGFDLLALRERVSSPTQVLAAPSFHAMLGEAAERYDFVLLDAPPLEDRAAMSLLVRLADATLLVVRPGATTSAEMARAIAPLTEDQVLGVVLNRAAR